MQTFVYYYGTYCINNDEMHRTHRIAPAGLECFKVRRILYLKGSRKIYICKKN